MGAHPHQAKRDDDAPVSSASATRPEDSYPVGSTTHRSNAIYCGDNHIPVQVRGPAPVAGVPDRPLRYPVSSAVVLTFWGVALLSWRRRKGGHPWHDHKAKAATRFFSCGQSFIGVWRDPPSSIPHTPPSSFYSSSSSPFPSSSSFSPPLPPPHSAQARARIYSQRIQSNHARIRFLTLMRRWHALGSERGRERERESA